MFLQVAVCAPSRSSRYLNITLKNISKVGFFMISSSILLYTLESMKILIKKREFHLQVITKDTPVLPKESHFETSAKNPVPVNGRRWNFLSQSDKKTQTLTWSIIIII